MQVEYDHNARDKLCRVLLDEYTNFRRMFDSMRGVVGTWEWRQDIGPSDITSPWLSFLYECQEAKINPLHHMHATFERYVTLSRPEFASPADLLVFAWEPSALSKIYRDKIEVELKSAIHGLRSLKERAKVLFGSSPTREQLQVTAATYISNPVVYVGIVGDQATEAERSLAIRTYLMAPDLFDLLVPRYVDSAMKTHPRFLPE